MYVCVCVRYRLAHLWKDFHENLQGGPGSSKEGFRPKKFLARPHPGVQGQKRLKGLGLGLFYLFVFIPFYPGQCRVLQLVSNKHKTKTKKLDWLVFQIQHSIIHTLIKILCRSIVFVTLQS